MVSRSALVVVTSFVLSLVACGGPPAGPSDPDPTPPAAPSNVTVVPGPGSVTISWEHDGVDVTGFVIRRETVAVTAASAARASTDVGEVGAEERSFVDDTVEEGVAYRYAVAARGSDGSVSESTEHGGEPVVPDQEEAPASLEFELIWEAVAARGDGRAVAFDPSGARLATGVFDSRAYVWDLGSDEAVLVLSAGSTVSAIGFAPDGGILATGGNSLILWDASDGSDVRRFNLNEDPSGPREWVNDLTFSPDGASVAIASNSGYVRVFSVATGEELLALDVGAGVEGASLLHGRPDAESQRVVIEDSDGVQRLDVHGVGASGVHTSATIRVQSVGFSPDGTKLVSGSADGSVRVWDAATGESIRSLDGFTNDVMRVRFSPDGSAIAAAGGGGVSPVLVWTEATGDVALSIDALGGGSVRAIDFAPGGERLAGVGGDGRAFVWDLVADEVALSWPAHRAASGIAFDATGTRIATVGGRKDGRAVVWAADSATEVAAWQHGGRVADVALSPDGTQVVAGADDGMVSAWSTATGDERFVNDEAFDARVIAYSPSGDRIAIADYSHISMVDSETGASVLRFRTPEWMFSLAFDADGSRIASGLWDRSVHVWDAATGDPLTAIDAAHAQGQLETLAFTPDDDNLVSGVGYLSGAAEFAVWNSVSGVEVERRDANTHGVFAVAFADDGASMLTGGRSSVLTWDTDTWEQVGHLAIDGTVASLIVDDDVLIVGGWGMPSVLFLDRVTGDQLGAVPVPAWSLDFDAASGRLVVATGSTVQVWEVSTP